MIALDLDTIDAIAVAAGPGSFTGLRIGSATAKGLGLALDKPIISVSTIEAMAYNLWGSADNVCPIMDARRGQTYTGLYHFTDTEMECIVEPCAVDITEIIEKINAMGGAVTFLGDGVPVFQEAIADKCKVPYHFAPAHMNRQRAASLCARAEAYYLAGKVQTAASTDRNICVCHRRKENAWKRKRAVRHNGYPDQTLQGGRYRQDRSDGSGDL